MSKRDADLGEPLKAGAEGVVFELTASAGMPNLIEFLRGDYPKQEVIARYEHDLYDALLYKSFSATAENRSRTKYVEMLKEAGFSGKANAIDPKVQVPPSIQSRLNDLSIFAQYDAARQLHALTRQRGESPEVLGALVQAYANLGLLTETHWSPAADVYKARALLYAQRMQARGGPPGWPNWHLAYALAMCGLQANAVEEIGLAEAAAKKAGSTVRPAWADLLRSYAMADIAGITKQFDAMPQLAHLLNVIAHGEAGSAAATRRAAERAIEVLPDNYRIHDVICSGSPDEAALAVNVRRAYESLTRNLKPGLTGMQEIPTKIAAEAPATTGRPKTSDNGPLPEDVRLRATILSNLSRLGAPGLDAGEPSWAAVGQSLRDVAFLQAWRMSKDPTKEGAPELWPELSSIFAGHRMGPFLQMRTSAPAERQLVIKSIRNAIPWDILELHERGAFDMLESYDEALFGRCLGIAFMHQDETARDLTFVCQNVGNPLQVCKRLYAVNPYSPVARTLMIDGYWNEVQRDVAVWSTAAQHQPRLLLAMGKKYVSLNRQVDAERCLARAVELDPNYEAFHYLAEVYLKQGNAEQRLATLEAALEHPANELEHARARVNIAEYYMSLRRWKQALPYAEEAAKSNAAWALLATADAYEGLQDWEQSEQWVRQAASHYSDLGLRWYLWHRRTGQGDADEAQTHALQTLERADRLERLDPFEIVVFYLVNRQFDKALQHLEADFEQTNNPSAGLRIAMITDEQGDMTKRDAAYAAIQARGLTFVGKPPNTLAPRKELIALAAAFAKDLTDGGKADFDLKALEKLRASGSPSEQMNFNYFLGAYLQLHGKHADAVRYWTQCMTYPRIWDYNRTLAGAALWDLGITPSSYRPELQTPTDLAKGE